jgi:hypothetical protein
MSEIVAAEAAPQGITPQDEENYAQAQAHSQQVDYFGFERTEKFVLPDGISYIEIKAMNEGAKARYQRDTTRPIVIEKGGNASTRIDPAATRHALIEHSVVGWNLTRGGKPFGFSPRFLRDFLETADPKIVEDLELAIRKLNPWLNDDLTVEEIDKEIDRLKELREAARERELGEGSSAAK